MQNYTFNLISSYFFESPLNRNFDNSVKIVEYYVEKIQYYIQNYSHAYISEAHQRTVQSVYWN